MVWLQLSGIRKVTQHQDRHEQNCMLAVATDIETAIAQLTTISLHIHMFLTAIVHLTNGVFVSLTAPSFYT